MAGLSQFVSIQRRGEKTILFDVFKGEIAFTSIRFFEALKQGAISDLPTRLRLAMLKNGMMVSDSKSEPDHLHREFAKQKTSSAVLCFTLTPTYRCNCACRTCFQNDYDKELKMDDRTCLSVISLVKKRMKEKRPSAVVLWLYGGEPFSYARKCLEMVDAIKNACQSAGIICYIYVTSNGTLVESGRGKDLSARLDHFYISLSQSEVAQQMERPYKNGRNSYQDVLRGCGYLAGQNKQITLRFNISDLTTLHQDIPVVFNDLFTCFGGTPYDKICFEFSTLNRQVQHCLIDEDTVSQNSDREGSLNSEIRRLVPGMNLPWHINHFKLPVERGFVPYSSNACGFELCGYLKGDSYFIAPDGSMYMCNITENNADYLLGNVSEHKAVLDNEFYNHVLNFDLFSNAECKTCLYLPLCLRDCPLQAVKKGGGLKHNNCKKNKQTLVQKQIDYLWENWQKQGLNH